jgi:7-keto-8-aminopelargonate synthetase-like enzyme
LLPLNCRSVPLSQYLKKSQVERDGQRRNVRSLKSRLNHLGIPMVPSPGHIIPIHVCICSHAHLILAFFKVRGRCSTFTHRPALCDMELVFHYSVLQAELLSFLLELDLPLAYC